MSSRRGFLIALLALAPLRAERPWAERAHAACERFMRAWNRHQKADVGGQLNRGESPYSPAFREAVTGGWRKRKIAEKFEQVRKVML